MVSQPQRDNQAIPDLIPRTSSLVGIGFIAFSSLALACWATYTLSKDAGVGIWEPYMSGITGTP
jgi:hypothetical protein